MKKNIFLLLVAFTIGVQTAYSENSFRVEKLVPGEPVNMGGSTITSTGLSIGDDIVWESGDDTMVIVLGGKTEFEEEGKKSPMDNNDIVFVKRGTKAVLRGIDSGAEIIKIDFGKKKNWSLFSARTKGAISSVPFDFTTGQISTLFPGVDQRYFKCGEMKVSFLRIAPGAKVPENKAVMILRGTITGADSKTAVKNDIVSIPADCCTAGPEGCEVIVISPEGREYAKAHDRLVNSYESLIAGQPECVLDGDNFKPGLTFTEGPSWMQGALYFSNYYMYRKPWGSSPEGGIWKYTPGKGQELLNAGVQTCGTYPLPNGNLAACDLINSNVSEFTREGKFVRVVADKYNGIPFGRPNDLVADSKGGIYFSDCVVAKEEPRQDFAAYYYIALDGSVSRVTAEGDYGFPNGCALNPDGSLFYTCDSASSDILMYDIAPDGKLLNKRLFARMHVADSALVSKNPRSNADGMTVDREGNVFVAHPLGIQIFAKTGQYRGKISFPQNITHCEFGGDDLSTLYVTSRTRIYAVKTRTAGVKRF